MQFIWQVLLMIDGVIYDLIYYVFQIFFFLARINIFGEDSYNDIVRRIYIILGIFMLFVLAYSLLRAVVSPDDFAKGENSFPNLVKNVVISIVIIMVLPTVFSVAFNFQNAVLNNDTIPRLILGDENQDTVDENNLNLQGRYIVYELFNAFFSVNGEYCVTELGTTEFSIDECRGSIIGNGSLFLRNGDPLTDYDEIIYAGSSFTYYSSYSEAVAAREINYLFPISTVAGVFFLYVLLNFTFDMAVRVIKLAFYQLIAPIPVICRILPGGNMKDVFSKWVKQIISVFVEVFIRVGILAICIYLMRIVINLFSDTGAYNPYRYFDDPLLGFITFALLIMGIVVFMRQAPKLLGELLNLDTGGMKLGLMDKLAMGGGLFAATAVGGTALSLGRNAVSAVQRIRKTNAETKGMEAKDRRKALAKSAFGGAASIFGGAGAGLLHGVKKGKGAKNFGDVRGGIVSTADEITENRVKRDAKAARYKAAGLNPLEGRVSDALDSAKAMLGINDIAAYVADNEAIDDISSKKKAVRTSVEDLIDSEANKSSSSFEYGNYSATKVREKLLAIQDARAGKLTDANGKLISVSQAQSDYDKYRYEFSQILQNVALSDEKYNALDDKTMAKLADAQSKGRELKITLSRNLDKDYVRDSGFTIENVMGDLDVSSGPLDKIGDKMDLKRAQNNNYIAEYERQQHERDKEKKG